MRSGKEERDSRKEERNDVNFLTHKKIEVGPCVLHVHAVAYGSVR